MFLEYLFIFFLSSVKFAVAIPLAIFQYKFSIISTILITSMGGIFGVFVFTFLTQQILKIWELIIRKNKFKKRKTFTVRNRLVVWAKSKYGLIGLAILTPVLLSIPVGTFITIRYYKNYWKSITSLVLSVVFWATLISTVGYYF